MEYTVYILQSLKTKRYYIGYTGKMENRLQQHNDGMTRSTKSGVPWEVVYTEVFDSKSDAIKREREIKSYKGNSRFQALVKNNR